MEIGTIRGIGTAIILIAFIGIVFWAYSGKRKRSFDEAAMLPFEDKTETDVDENAPTTDVSKDQNSSRSTHQ